MTAASVLMLSLVAGTTMVLSEAAYAADNPATIVPALNCEALKGFSVPGSTLLIEKADVVAEAPPGTVQVGPPDSETVGVKIPSNCRAQGVIDKRVGGDGKNYAIGFAIALPDRWNGRLVYQGGGGLNGSIRPPLGAQAAGDTPALARGFAVVSTDSGHQGTVFDGSFMKDQEAAMNFAHGSVGKVAAAAKAIIARYYGQPPARSYLVGCSTGGREGMLASQRYPGEFDGIVAGAPAMRTGRSNLGLAWANYLFTQISPKDATGKPETNRAFSPSDKKLVTDAIVAACDAQDGLKDGMIFNRRQCQFDPASLACSGPKTDACLAPAQAGALAKAFAGPTNSRVIQELNHRSQNLFAVIQAIASRSLAEGQTVGDAKAVLNGRLAALARAYRQLAESSFSGASLHQILAQELSAFSKQIRVIGQDVFVNTPAAQNFALIIHELTTNAIKYGALSCPEGQVHVECRILDQNGRSQFQLVWNEMGGPTVSPPTRKGFGSAILVELAKSFAENVQINYAPGGLVYEIQLPLSAIEPPQAQVLTSPTATAGA